MKGLHLFKLTWAIVVSMGLIIGCKNRPPNRHVAGLWKPENVAESHQKETLLSVLPTGRLYVVFGQEKRAVSGWWQYVVNDKILSVKLPGRRTGLKAKLLERNALKIFGRRWKRVYGRQATIQLKELAKKWQSPPPQ